MRQRHHASKNSLARREAVSPKTSGEIAPAQASVQRVKPSRVPGLWQSLAYSAPSRTLPTTEPAAEGDEQEANRVADSIAYAAPSLPDYNPRNDSVSSEAAQPASTALAGEAARGQGHRLDDASLAFYQIHLGQPLSEVRLHTDARAAASARAVGAAAYTVGQHIVFGAGAMRGSLQRQRWLLSHELTHVAQNGRQPASASTPRLAKEKPEEFIAEHESLLSLDETALGSALYARVAKDEAQIPFVLSVFNALGTGQRDEVAYAFVEPLSETELTRFGGSEKGRELLVRLRSEMTGGIEWPAESDEIERLRTAPLTDLLKSRTADGVLRPGDWREIREFVAARGVGEGDLVHAFVDDGVGFDYPAAESVAQLVLGQNPALDEFTRDLTLSVDDVAAISTIISSEIVLRFFEDLQLTRDEFAALRALHPGLKEKLIDDLKNQTSLDESTRTSLTALIVGSGPIVETLVRGNGLFPIELTETESAEWNAELAPRMVRELLTDDILDASEVWFLAKENPGYDRKAVLEKAGIDREQVPKLADALAGIAEFKTTRLELRLVSTEGGWRLTEQSYLDVSLARFASDQAKLGAPGTGEFAEGAPELRTGVRISDESERDLLVDASVTPITASGAKFEVVLPTSMAVSERELITKLLDAVSHVPPQHLPLIKNVVFYPGPDPGGFAAADATTEPGWIRIFSGGLTSERFIHEVGHLVGANAGTQGPKFWGEWEQAIEQDGREVSLYGASTSREDFAEAYYLYVTSGGINSSHRAVYPRRFAMLDALF